jgi:hypothetical protein
MQTCVFRLAADLIVALHAVFVLFVMLGGLLAFRWRWLPWIHLPATVWGIAVEFSGWICPLTPLENYLRQRGGAAQYGGDFIQHYVFQWLYPVDLTRSWQLLLGGLALAANALIYWRLFLMRQR